MTHIVEVFLEGMSIAVLGEIDLGKVQTANAIVSDDCRIWVDQCSGAGSMVGRVARARVCGQAGIISIVGEDWGSHIVGAC